MLRNYKHCEDNNLSFNQKFLIQYKYNIYDSFVELKNREYYMTHDVRPPFTYATLIRQVCNRNLKKNNLFFKLIKLFFLNLHSRLSSSLQIIS